MESDLGHVDKQDRRSPLQRTYPLNASREFTPKLLEIEGKLLIEVSGEMARELRSNGRSHHGVNRRVDILNDKIGNGGEGGLQGRDTSIHSSCASSGSMAGHAAMVIPKLVSQ
ncbi:hypothetical protein EV1_039982 [Malus domestica]